MVALTGWSTPSSVPSVTSGPAQSIQYLSGNYITVAANGAATAQVRYASDPTGTWSTATMPAAPSGMTSVVGPIRPVMAFDGTSYAFAATYTDGATREYRILYATSLSGTWSSYEFDTSDDYVPSGIGWLNGEWVLWGMYTGSDPYRAFIATCSTLTGTWTFYNTDAETGVDTSGVPTGTFQSGISGMDYAGGAYVHTWYNGIGEGGVKTATVITSSWSDPTSINSYPDYSIFGGPFRANGYWFVACVETATSYAELAYATDPTGTWGALTETDLDLVGTGLFRACEVYGISHDGTNYVPVGTRTSYSGGLRYDSYSAYLGSTSTPAGTYAAVSSGLATGTQHGVRGVTYGDPYHVVVQQTGAIRYSNSIPYIPPATPTATTYLRMRQSPVRTPSRVRPPQVRQRQRPEVT